MDKRTKNKIDMYKAVAATCAQYPSELSTLPAFDGSLSAFAAKLADLEQATYLQSTSTVGITASKDALRSQAVVLAETVSSGLRAYAAVTGNTLLSEQAHVRRSHLQKGGKQVFLNLIDRVLTLANDHAYALTDYGVEFYHINDLSALRQQLGDMLQLPRQAIVARQEYTLQIEELTAALDGLLREQLDPMATVLKTSAPGFWKRYKAARVIVDLKGKKPDGDDPGGGKPIMSGN